MIYSLYIISWGRTFLYWRPSPTLYHKKVLHFSYFPTRRITSTIILSRSIPDGGGGRFVVGNGKWSPSSILFFYVVLFILRLRSLTPLSAKWTKRTSSAPNPGGWRLEPLATTFPRCVPISLRSLSRIPPAPGLPFIKLMNTRFGFCFDRKLVFECNVHAYVEITRNRGGGWKT